jgi:hypothetical protein
LYLSNCSCLKFSISFSKGIEKKSVSIGFDTTIAMKQMKITRIEIENSCDNLSVLQGKEFLERV